MLVKLPKNNSITFIGTEICMIYQVVIELHNFLSIQFCKLYSKTKGKWFGGLSGSSKETYIKL